MAFYCNDCQYIFDVKKFSCPYCGNRVYSDETPESELLKEGYSKKMLAPKGRTATPQNSKAPEVHIEDNDILSSIRSSYQTEHQNTHTSSRQTGNSATATQTTANRQTHETGTTTQTAGSTPIDTAQPERATADLNTHQGESGFFAQFTGSTQSVTVPTGSQQPMTEVKEPNDYNRELQSLERQRRRLERSYRRGEFLDGLIHFNWGLFFRILFILGVIAAILFIWSMRYVILSSITDFAMSVIPVVLVIAIFWNLIKSLFKGD